MGYCGIKIPGHSGTDFKHKKVFKDSKTLLKHNAIIQNVRIESREAVPNYNIFHYIKIVTVISFAITILILIGFFVSRIGKLKIHKTYISSEYLMSKENEQKKEAAEMMYKSAKMYFDSGALDYAQEEMIRVLKIYPTNNEALVLMQSILAEQCKVNNKFCKNAKAYKEYLTLTNSCKTTNILTTRCTQTI